MVSVFGLIHGLIQKVKSPTVITWHRECVALHFTEKKHKIKTSLLNTVKMCIKAKVKDRYLKAKAKKFGLKARAKAKTSHH